MGIENGSFEDVCQKLKMGFSVARVGLLVWALRRRKKSPHYLQGFIHPKWFFLISSINSMVDGQSIRQPSQLMGDLLYIHRVPLIYPHQGTVTNEVYKDYIYNIPPKNIYKHVKRVVILVVIVTSLRISIPSFFC